MRLLSILGTFGVSASSFVPLVSLSTYKVKEDDLVVDLSKIKINTRTISYPPGQEFNKVNVTLDVLLNEFNSDDQFLAFYNDISKVENQDKWVIELDKDKFPDNNKTELFHFKLHKNNDDKIIGTLEFDYNIYIDPNASEFQNYFKDHDFPTHKGGVKPSYELAEVSKLDFINTIWKEIDSLGDLTENGISKEDVYIDRTKSSYEKIYVKCSKAYGDAWFYLNIKDKDANLIDKEFKVNDFKTNSRDNAIDFYQYFTVQPILTGNSLYEKFSYQISGDFFKDEYTESKTWTITVSDFGNNVMWNYEEDQHILIEQNCKALNYGISIKLHFFCSSYKLNSHGDYGFKNLKISNFRLLKNNIN